MDKIPFLDLRAAYLELKPLIDAASLRVLDSGWYIGGTEVETFERQFAAYCQTNFCIGTANGLDALHLALRALNVSHGDEVIVPSNTYIATWLAISYTGATIVPVEPNEFTYNINPELIEAAITPKTKVILVVHLYGQPVDLAPILEVAKRYNLHILEDAAQAHGAKYQNQPIGGHGDIVAWSFYPGKNLGAMGDGGAVTTNDPMLAEKIIMLRNYGSKEKYINQIIGYNSRLDPLQAAILGVKLPFLDQWNQRRQKISDYYYKNLKNTSFLLPKILPWVTPAWHLFVIRHSERNKLRLYLEQQGIGIVIHYPIPPHLQAAYSHLGYISGDFPISENIHNQVLSLPIGPHLTEEQMIRIVQVLQAFDSKA